MKKRIRKKRELLVTLYCEQVQSYKQLLLNKKVTRHKFIIPSETSSLKAEADGHERCPFHHFPSSPPPHSLRLLS